MKFLIVLSLVILGAVLSVESLSTICTVDAEPGMCKAYIPRYYHDVKSGTCKEFIYGGCGGNENNFETLQECVEKCGAGAATNVIDG